MLHKIKLYAITALLIFILTPTVHGMKQTKKVGVDTKSPQERINTSFVKAAQDGRCSRVQKLLPLVHDVNVKVGSENSSALGQAIMHRRKSVIRLLFEQPNLDLDSPINAEGCSPLAWATTHEDVELVKMLVFAKADIDAVDADGVHPLLLASESGSIDIVKLFLQHVSAKVIVQKTKKIGISALHIASQNGHDKVVELLAARLDKENIDACCNKEGAGPLLIACQEGHDKAAQALIKAKADVNLRRKEYGSTPLCAASLNGNPKTVHLLIDAKADVGIPDSRGFLPIHIAAEMGHLSVIEVLLNKKSDLINAQNPEGFTPLHTASYYGKLNAVALLLGNKANPALIDGQSKTALDYASSPAVRELLARGLVPRKPLTRNHAIKYRSRLYRSTLERVAENSQPARLKAQDKQQLACEDEPEYLV